MVALPPPTFSPSQIKSKLSLERYDALLTRVAANLQPLQGNEAWRFIQTYATDQAVQTTHQLSSALSVGDKRLRKAVFLLAERVADDADVELDIDTLLSIAVVYGAKNSTRVTALFERAFVSHGAELNAELHNIAIPGLAAALLPAASSSKKADESRLLRVAAALPVIVRSCQHVRSALARDPAFLSALATAYDRLPCADLLDALGPLFSLDGGDNTRAEETFGMLFPLLEKPALLKDYSAITGFADVLERRVGAGGADDPRLGYVLATLRADAHERALPAFLRNAPPAPPATNGKAKVADKKGKGKAKEAPQLDLDDPRIAQLADIFPSHSREFLAKCLHHPSFNGDVDAVVGALLEGNAPPDIMQETAGTPTPSPSRPASPVHATFERRNVFDDDDLDFAKLRVGKAAGDADSLLGDRAFAEQMKDDILRRVQEMSDSDLETEAGAADDADDVLAAGGVVRVRDGDADSDSEPQVDEAAKKQREIENMLELEYLRDAAQFARDAATRRSAARVDLRARTGWADEQIEGWAIMLERNPQKDKILAKHEFRGNRPAPAVEEEESSDEDTEEEGGHAAGGAPGASQQGRGRGRGRGRGGRGRGGGGGGGGAGGGDTARDRARKNARKNQDHRRGRDKKLARVGGPS